MQLNDRTRFAKCFVMIVEICRQWLQDFVENRLSARSPGITLLQYIKAHRRLPYDSMIKVALSTMTTSSQYDVSALRSIIVVGGLLDSHENKTTHHARHTLGDCVDRIREIRNTFMHTVSATLSQNDYNDYLTEFRDIAQQFETENNMKKREYVKMIEDIDLEPFEDTAVEGTIGYYNSYLDFVKLHEMVRIETPVCPPSPAEPLNPMFLNLSKKSISSGSSSVFIFSSKTY